MEQIELTINYYDTNGLVSTETKMINKPISTQERIERKEAQLIRVHEELERLKALNN